MTGLKGKLLPDGGGAGQGETRTAPASAPGSGDSAGGGEIAAIAKVAVSAVPYAADRPYDYLIPESLEGGAFPGVRVTAPFGRGNRQREGIILSRTTGEKSPRLKPLLELLDTAPALDQQDIALALWMCRRYFCTFYEAVRAILPTALWYHVRELWRLAETAALPPDGEKNLLSGDAASPPDGASGRKGREAEVLACLRARGGKAYWEEIRAACGNVHGVLLALERAGLARREIDTKRRLGSRMRRMAELALPGEEAAALTARGRSAVRREVVRFLTSSGRASCAEVCYYTGASPEILRKMEKAGLIAFTEEERLPAPQAREEEPPPPVTLNDEQKKAFEEIRALMAGGKPGAAVLYGVTGSGKTLVYLSLVREALEAGKTAMVLVPEIILTPRMMREFSARFGGRVAMLHSSLRMTERYDQWRRIRSGEAKVVLGARSAIFAPLRHIGLIVLDEEQEDSYQSELPPRYHTRDIAKYLCARDGGTLVLGSATPAVETAYLAGKGTYRLCALRERYNARPLPEVRIADLREEVRSGYGGLVGAELRREIGENLRRGEQSILFLNRRGASRMLLCGECGYVPECPRCSVPMTFHAANGRLMCHYCGHSERSREDCPACGGRMKHIGAGTQKVEEELRGLFPGAEILRMDADTATGRHEEILGRFERERIPILLGTQMVARGLDFENVTLVGVLLADMSLYVDHYRAAERTFNLLTQVVGRAGRGSREGRAVIQTYTPENDVIRAAARQDYRRFYESEIRLRRLRRYPPFADLFTLTASGTEEEAVLRGAVWVRETLRELCARPELRRWEPEVLGPAPAPVLKVNNRYRYRVVLAARNEKGVRDALGWLLREFPGRNRGVHLSAVCNGAD